MECTYPPLASSAELTVSWERASDIYEDYWHPTFLMASKMSMSPRFSVNVASGVAPSPPALQSPPKIDFNGSRQQVGSARSRQHFPHPSPQVLEGKGTMEEDKQNEDSDVEKAMDDCH